MALKAKGTKITMDAYDFGQILPFELTELSLEPGDQIIFELRKSKDTAPLIIKTYNNENADTTSFQFFLSFTQKETSYLFPGNYVYYLRHLRNGELRDTLVTAEQFKIKNE